MEDIVIRNGQTEIHLSSTGGTITSAMVGKLEILYPWRQIGDKARGGCHICAPWFGQSPRSKKKHGYLRDLEARDVKLESNNAKLIFHHPGNESYPWSLGYEIGVYAYTNGLKMTLRIDRMDDKEVIPAPVLPAFHPYFGCKDESTVRVLNGGAAYNGFSCESRSVGISSEAILIAMPSKNIMMELGGAFAPVKSQLVLWTDAPKDYVCVEPVLQNKRTFETPGGPFLCVDSFLDLSMNLTVAEY